MSDAAPVEVKNQDPISVQITPGPADAHDQRAAETLAGAKVDASILRTEGQRKINSIWERTQQIIALSVVETALIAVIIIIVRNETEQVQVAVTTLFGLANLVIGFYFGRTNHTRTGGTGAEDAGR